MSEEPELSIGQTWRSVGFAWSITCIDADETITVSMADRQATMSRAAFLETISRMSASCRADQTA